MGKFILELTRTEKQILVMGVAAYLNICKNSGLLDEDGEAELIKLHAKIRDLEAIE